MLMIEVFTGGEQPYPGMTVEGVVQHVLKGQQHPKPPTCPLDMYRNVILPCWHGLPSARIAFSTLVAIFDGLVRQADDKAKAATATAADEPGAGEGAGEGPGGRHDPLESVWSSYYAYIGGGRHGQSSAANEAPSASVKSVKSVRGWGDDQEHSAASGDVSMSYVTNADLQVMRVGQSKKDPPKARLPPVQAQVGSRAGALPPRLRRLRSAWGL